MRKMFKNSKAKHGLNLKMGFKTKFGLILGKQKRKRRREEEKREERKKERSSSKAKKVWKLTLSMDSMIFGIDFIWRARILWFCMDF